MKTPEDTKKGLEYCNNDFIPADGTSRCSHCPYDIGDEHPECADILHIDALAYIQQLESREWELFDLLSSAWHGKQYYFKQDDGTVYSRQSCKYITFEQAVEEFEGELFTSTQCTAASKGDT